MMDPKDLGRDRLIFALDVSTWAAGKALVDQLSANVGFFKIGLEAYSAGFGNDLRREITLQNARAFVDLKLHDIPETVSRAVTALSHKAHFTTVHATKQVMLAAAKAAQAQEGSSLKVLAVTVLTSMSDQDLTDDGYPADVKVQDMVRRRAETAHRSGVHGVIASPQEVKLIRAVTGPEFLIVCPGVRPAGADKGDQKRVATPRQAILDGADYVVVGRPIRDAADPCAAANEIVAEIQGALIERNNTPSSLGKIQM